MKMLDPALAETFWKNGTFLGGVAAWNHHPKGSEFWHDDAIWQVDHVSKYWDGMFLFYCVRIRTQRVDFR